MPWNTRDAKRFSKAASTPTKAKKWADAANAVLRETGDEARAVRIANATIKPKRRKR